MTPSVIVAAMINARLTSDLRRRLRAHAGSVVALHIGGARMLFRLAEDGSWRAAAALVNDADAEMRMDGGGLRVEGGGALLRDLDELRRRCAPSMLAEEMFGAGGADCLRRAAAAAGARLRDLPARCGVAAAPPDVAEFARRTAEFDAATNAAAARLARLSADGAAEKRR